MQFYIFSCDQRAVSFQFKRSLHLEFHEDGSSLFQDRRVYISKQSIRLKFK